MSFFPYWKIYYIYYFYYCDNLKPNARPKPKSSSLGILFDIITTVRNIRASKNVPMSKNIDLLLEVKSNDVLGLLENNKEYLQKFTNKKKPYKKASFYNNHSNTNHVFLVLGMQWHHE